MDIALGTPQVFLNQKDAEELGLHPVDRVAVVDMRDGHRITAIVNTTASLVPPGKVGVSEEVADIIMIREDSRVEVLPAARPKSVELIKKKMDGIELNAEEIRTVIQDIATGQLSDIELTAYAVSVYMHDLSLKEIVAMIDAMVETGESIEFDQGPILDIHSIGGVPGNKYAPLVVSTVASHGCIIPKTSSRAISSACGTADFMEVLCPVEHGAGDIKRIAETAGGTLCWGGGVRLAPADDAIIRVEYPLSMDPHGQLIASVLAKKKAVGAQVVVIEIPTGAGAKVEDEDKARRLARDFIAVGEQIGIKIRVAITFGEQPIGYAIGPALEAREALAALEGTNVPGNLMEKACELAGLLLELAGKTPKGTGYDMARETIESGQAHKTFLKIIELQGGNKDIKSTDIMPGKHAAEVVASKTGYVESIANKALIKVARAAGAPRDKGAGILLHHKLGEKVKSGQPVFTIYAEHAHKLQEAVALSAELRPYKIEGMIIEEIVE
ncbi:MAG: AMP phosphorylase [Euryarchaeota archaeon]|nr:AMP phosphorylase [Euryarchaeota archaeon]